MTDRHHVQLSLEPSTAKVSLLHDIQSITSKFNSVICCSPARQMLAPGSENMFILTDWIFLCLQRHADKMVGISSMLL